MSKIIAIAGKGGVGKSTITTIILKILLGKNIKPILVVDADPTSNLRYYLGIEIDKTISDVRDSIKEQTPPGMTKAEYFNLKANEIIVEQNGYDFLAMGHPEGKGCYCSVNNILRDFLSCLKKNYKVVLIDNEAGLEHLSRKTNDKIDVLLFVSISTIPGINAVLEGLKIVKKINMNIEKKYLIFNQTNKINNELSKQIKNQPELRIIGNIDFDPEIKELIEKGKNLFELSEQNKSYKTLENLIKELLD